ncbi:DUF5688 family protein [Butyrivibrio sp. JL13D10]|uniref:DUF5688 family protein n=1 Tax=Butyrivibrio sp. JL13D10 TaxID=3236815 RepID=UPI0038B5AE80
MITKNMIFAELTNRGFNVDVREVTKNGVKKEAFCIVDDNEKHNAIPTFYVDKVIQKAQEMNFSLNDIVDDILEMHEKSLANFNIDCMKDKEFILSHLSIGLQKESSEELIKRKCEFEGLEAYLFMKVTFNGIDGTIKLNGAMLDIANIKDDEAWKRAEKNLHEDTVIEPLTNYFKNIIGADDFSELENYMFILTNKSKVKGASSVLDRKAIKKLGESRNIRRFVYLPSSIHESILIPADGSVDLEEFKSMVREVNRSVLNEEDKLIDNAYFLNV